VLVVWTIFIFIYPSFILKSKTIWFVLYPGNGQCPITFPSVVWYVRSEGVSRGVCGREDRRLLWGCAGCVRDVQIRAALLCVQGFLWRWRTATEPRPHGPQWQSPQFRCIAATTFV